MVKVSLLNLLLFCSAAVCLDMPEQPEYNIEGLLMKQIEKSPKYVQDSWTIWQVKEAARIIQEAKEETLYTVIDILKIIRLESGFFNGAYNRNADGTYDMGLTQQNSAYVSGRCQEMMGKKCDPKIAYDVIVNLRLFIVHAKWCSEKFKTKKNAIVCYNSPQNAVMNRFSYYDRVQEQHIYW